MYYKKWTFDRLTVSRNDTAGPLGQPAFPCVLNSSGETLCDIYGNSETVKAYAYLFAAAPDLLEACRAGLYALEEISIEDGPKYISDINMMREAIAKAEGK